MSEADKIIKSLRDSGKKVEEFYVSNKTSDKNVANIEIIENFIFELKSFGLNKDTLEVANELENLLSDYTRQKQINEEHKKLNGELRERVKELDTKNDELLKDLYSANCIIADLTDSIPKQVVIDKMEELNKEIKSCDEIDAIFKIKQQQVLQELLEGGRK